MHPGHVVRATVNALNLWTAFGLLTAKLGHAQLSRGERGTILATDYRLGFPVSWRRARPLSEGVRGRLSAAEQPHGRPCAKAPAFTVGNVVLTTFTRAELLERPRLLAHQERHTWQYLACIGLPMIPLYLLAAVWSWLGAGDFVSRNAFERLAGLADGGYPLRGPGSPVRIFDTKTRA